MPLADLLPVVEATWATQSQQRSGPFTVPFALGGGNRVSAIRLSDPHLDNASEAAIDEAIAVQQSAGQAPLFMVLDDQTKLDVQLAARGFESRDATLALTMACKHLAAAPPPVSCFNTWPPLAIQAEIWADGGIGPARLAIMDRVARPKMSFFGRIKDKPAGTAFTAIHGDVAMLHALEIAEPFRRQGLAQIMMRAAGDWALSQGASVFAVLVTRENQPAGRLYASLGFKPVGHYHYRTATA